MLSDEIARLIQLDMRALRLASMTLREITALGAEHRYELRLGGMLISRFRTLDAAEAYLDAIERQSETFRR